jgi:hypothetical protein
MSRIYQSETKASFQGSAQGGRFQPKQAVDSSEAINEYKSAIAQDFDTQSREQQRKDQAENLQLSMADQAEATGLALQASFDTFGLEAQQLYENNVAEREQLAARFDIERKGDRLKSNAIKTDLISGTITSLLSFAGSAVQYGEDVREYEERELRITKLREAQELKDQKEAQTMSYIYNDASWTGSGDSPADVTKTIDTQVSTVNTSIGKIASGLESSGDIDDIQAATALRNDSPAVPWLGAQGDVYSLTNNHMGLLQDLLNSMPEASRPKTRAAAESFFRQATADLLKSSGVGALPQALVMDVFGPTAVQNIKLLTDQAVTGANAAQKLEAQNRTKSAAASMMRSGADPTVIWQEGTATYSGGSFNAKDNLEFAEFIYQQAAAMGDAGKDFINRLQGVPKIKGQPNGPTFGESYGYLAQQYLDKAETAQKGFVDVAQAEAVETMYEELAKPENANNSAARTRIVQDLVAKLERLGRYEVAALFKDKLPDLNNPENQELNAERYEEMVRNKEIVDPKFFDSRIDINPEERARLKDLVAEVQDKLPDNKEAEGYVEAQAKEIAKDIERELGVKKPLGGEITYSLEGVNGVMIRDITEASKRQVFKAARDALVATAGQSQDAQMRAVREAVRDWYQTNITNPDGDFNFKPQKVIGDYGEGTAGSDQARKQKVLDLLASPGAMRRGQMSSEWKASVRSQAMDLDAGSVMTFEQVDAYNVLRQDTIYTKDAQRQMAASYMESGKIPQSVIDNAKLLGISPLSLLNIQNSAQNLPTTVYSPPARNSTSLGTQSSSPQEVRNYLLSQGLPEASADYLAGNVPQDITAVEQTLEKLKGVTLPDTRNGYDVFTNPYSSNRDRTAALSSLQKMSYSGTYSGGSMAIDDVMAIHQLAQRLQVDPYSLGALIHLESRHNPNIWGGDGGKYKGLIQFGPGARSEVGLPDRDMTIPEQVPYIEKYFQQRGFKPGQHSVKELYRTVLVGNPYQSGTDSFGTNSDSAAEQMKPGGSLYRQVQQMYGTFTPQ